MTDPCWLPSAIMQTVGALYGIFIAFFILILQNLNNYRNDIIIKNSKGKFEKKLDYFEILFKWLAIVVVITELYNGLIAYFISDSIFERFRWLLLFSYITFIVSICYIIGFSYILISFFVSLLKRSPDIETPDNLVYNSILSRINMYDFLKIVIALSFCFLLSVAAVFMYYKFIIHL